MTVFVTRKIMPFAVKLLEDAGITVIQWTEDRNLSSEELLLHVQNYEALLHIGSGKLDSHFLNACSHLKVIALHAVGYDHVDIAEATRLGIPIGNSPGVLSAATADVAFLLMLAVSRNAFYMSHKIKEGKWAASRFNEHLGVELYGKTIGIFGLGKIGFEMARRCQAMYQMKVLYCNRGHHHESEKELGALRVSFDELLQQSDVISVHANLSAETKEVFNAAAFSKMKAHSIFINTARGGLHDEADLIKALKQHTIWGAGLDVTNPEPMEPTNPLLEMPNVCVLPHIGSATVETREAMIRLAAENIIAGLTGKKLPHVVNPDVYQSPA